MARLSRFYAVAVLLGGATASLSACTGDADPAVSPSPSVTADVTPSPSVSPTPTELSDEELLALIPEDARAEDFQSASIFARFFLGLYPQMMQTKDSRLFALLSDDACQFCRNALDSYDELVASNGSVTGGDITFGAELATGGLQPDGTTNASFDAETAVSEYLDEDGNVTSTVPARSGRFGVSLRYRDGHWTVLGVGSEGA